MKVITAPEDYSTAYRSIFLAGSIEQDKAEKWQDRIIKALVNTNITILNPRRESWDATWVQAIENTQFREQVEWEIGALEQATKILMYFDPATKSPISLLELGLFARTGKLIVCCPDGFWRKGNVDIVCKMYGVATVADINELVLVTKLLIG